MSKIAYLRLHLGPSRSNETAIPKTAELVKLIREQILSLTIPTGFRLPPVRVLAHQLGVSKNTIEAVYEELKAQGLVESVARQGLFVVAQEPDILPRPLFVGASPLPLKKINFPKQRLLSNTHKDSNNHHHHKKRLHLTTVWIDPTIFPKAQLTACFKSVLKIPGLSHHYYVQGFLPLRQKIAERLRRHGIDVDAEEIITTSGSQQGLDLVTRILGSRCVATENPAYALGKALLEAQDLQVVGLPIDPFRSKATGVEEWEKIIKASRPGLIYLTSNFQNANGHSYTTQELSTIISWSKKYQFGLLEDDWGSDMLSYSEFRPGLRALGGEEVLYINTFTKKLLPSLRLGYLVAPKSLIPSLLMAKEMSTMAVPPLLEATLFEFLDRGYYDTYLKQLHLELDHRYQNCLHLLKELMPPDVQWTTPGGGPVLWLSLPKSVNLDLLSSELEKKGVIVDMNEDAYFGPPHLHGLKIGHAYLNLKEMQEALSTLSYEIKKQLFLKIC